MRGVEVQHHPRGALYRYLLLLRFNFKLLKPLRKGSQASLQIQKTKTTEEARDMNTLTPWNRIRRKL